jgi:hypothetical protein
VKSNQAGVFFATGRAWQGVQRYGPEPGPYRSTSVKKTIRNSVAATGPSHHNFAADALAHCHSAAMMVVMFANDDDIAPVMPVMFRYAESNVHVGLCQADVSVTNRLRR